MNFHHLMVWRTTGETDSNQSHTRVDAGNIAIAAPNTIDNKQCAQRISRPTGKPVEHAEKHQDAHAYVYEYHKQTEHHLDALLRCLIFVILLHCSHYKNVINARQH